MAVRDFGHVLELLILKRQMQVPKGLLLRNDHHVILLGVVDQFSGFLRSNGAARGCHQGQAGISKGILHVKREQVDFVFGQQGDFPLEGCQRGDGAAADVDAHPAPAHGGPIYHAHDRSLCAACRRVVKQLPQRLDAVKHARCGLTHY